jgi:hypothetical protein
MTEEKQEHSHAYHGSDWPQHEDFLVGDRRGLQELQAAIEEALEKGESLRDAGEFVGVRCLESDFFTKEPAPAPLGARLLGWSLGILLLIVFGVGLATIGSWIFPSNCG